MQPIVHIMPSNVHQLIDALHAVKYKREARKCYLFYITKLFRKQLHKYTCMSLLICSVLYSMHQFHRSIFHSEATSGSWTVFRSLFSYSTSMFLCASGEGYVASGACGGGDPIHLPSNYPDSNVILKEGKVCPDPLSIVLKQMLLSFAENRKGGHIKMQQIMSSTSDSVSQHAQICDGSYHGCYWIDLKIVNGTECP